MPFPPIPALPELASMVCHRIYIASLSHIIVFDK